MKIRIEGTTEGLASAKEFYERLESNGLIKILAWSRVYVEVEIN